ncbi:MAG: LytTR family DNA-binding domain-containing protein [Bacteroidia bacterium]|nr:LytTR family DNA-binding domain-containing protein [Bacteroidia bacterium]
MNSYIHLRRSLAFKTNRNLSQHLVGDIKNSFQQMLKSKEQKQYFEFSTKTKHIKIPFSDILFIKASHVYIEIICTDGRKELIRKSLRSMKSKILSENFLQCHRSYIVNINQVDSWNSKQLYMQDYEIPISRSKKKDLLKRLKN